MISICETQLNKRHKNNILEGTIRSSKINYNLIKTLKELEKIMQPSVFDNVIKKLIKIKGEKNENI